jgi:MerR family transcriptional regulator, heat shock protein HspR
MSGRLDDLDNPEYPAYTTGRAAEVLGVRQAFLRALDSAGVVTPQRTEGGRRRYTRRQLALAGRIRGCSTRATPWPPRCGSWPWKTT